MAISAERLSEIVDYLRTRPGHEHVRAVLRELWVVGLDVRDREIDFEVPLPEVRGRLDAMFGSTIFEVKRDLRQERRAAEIGLARYLGDRERATGQRYLGIATDGAEFVAYQLTKGKLEKLEEFVPKSDDPRSLLRWLDKSTTVRSDLYPDPQAIRDEFGRESMVFRRAIEELRRLWESARGIPEAKLKKELWGRHLEFVYGTLIEPDELFLQHTYLTIVAKTMAVRVLVSGKVPAGELLAGTPFARAGLQGAIEADFFDWVLLVADGADLVDRVSSQVGRFRLNEIEADVLKSIYESLIDPKQRHYLGEYYTPDWLAEWICEQTLEDPLTSRVLDPSCGSGTFLFHAVRRFLEAAEGAGMSLQVALERCREHVVGIDVHPVAVLFARVTYLLAIGADRLKRRSGDVFIPVYLGDAMQWDVRQFLTEEEIEIVVPGEKPLRFPGTVAGNPNLLELILRMMRELADQNAPAKSFQKWINSPHFLLSNSDQQVLLESYDHLRNLHAEGRNHIWTYIVRNLTRPLWLTLKEGKPNVLIGNPPWLRYNAMSPALKTRFRRESTLRGLWVGGKLATHQDLSSYFFARSVERYLSVGGRVAFVMPLATLSRGQYEGFRTGRFADSKGNTSAIVRFERVWTFDSDVSPLFQVPSCVIFAQKAATAGVAPKTVTAFSGYLPRRDATSAEATNSLKSTRSGWPASSTGTEKSIYSEKFRQGATIVPRRLLVVVRSEEGRFGSNRDAPFIEGRVGSQDKAPWRNLSPIKAQVERDFLFPLLLGESIAPFRSLETATAVVPIQLSTKRLLNARSALDEGYPHLASWFRKAERVWNENRSSNISLLEQIDYYGKLSSQFPIKPIRVVYAASGTLPCALVVENRRAIIEHANYWYAADSLEEANYLVAILNSEAARARIAGLQSRGLWGARHFDKLMFSLPIPKFSSNSSKHVELAKLGEKARKHASLVPLNEQSHFQRARKEIRTALVAAGISKQIDSLVSALLNG